MEASLLDMTRDHGAPVFAFAAMDPGALEVEIEVVPNDDDEPWFAAHDDALGAGDELAFPPIATRQSLTAVLGVATAVAIAACLYAATL